LSNIGKTINKIRDGITSQKILSDRLITFFTFFVSTYSHTIARIEVKGSDAMRPPRRELLFAISDTVIIIITEIIIFKT